MATIKSFTDISQSKKLAEILPLESADMYWKDGLNHPAWLEVGEGDYNKEDEEDNDVPAWSLTALMDFMANTGFLFALRNIRLPFSENKWSVSCDTNDEWFQIKACSPVDACYEMICKLKERNLI